MHSHVYNCTLCDAQLPTRQELKNHVLCVHEGKIPHICSYCDKSFTSKSGLQSHIKGAHEGKNERPQDTGWSLDVDPEFEGEPLEIECDVMIEEKELSSDLNDDDDDAS